jgi:hypothetical protein
VESEPYSAYILAIVFVSMMIVIILPEILSWRRRRQMKREPGSVVHKNVKRRCRKCGRPVFTDVFAINPTCIVCQDKES